MNSMTHAARFSKFIISLGLILLAVYGLLPALTRSVDILHRMSLTLEETAINPSHYYYTDVEQVSEAEHYLATRLDQNKPEQATRAGSIR